MKTPTRSQLQRGMQRYLAGDRPWPERARAVDWFIASKKGELFPLKYTYGLAVDQRPALYTTNQMKRRLKGLNLTFVSLKVSHSHDADFQRAVSASLVDRTGRKKRLKAALPKPTQRVLVQNVFVRNADVVAEVLERADGHCEKCGKPAPFLRAKDKRPYLEVHHKITLASGGDDTVANAVAVCPNCHREAHHG